MDKSGGALAERIRKLHTSLVREINDQHIFVHQALPVLLEARKAYARSTDGTDRKYFVPSLSKQSVARRTDAELKKIYDAFVDRELFATSLIAAVSRAEAFVFDVLRAVLREYPKKLSIGARGGQGELNVPLSIMLNASELADVLEAMISRRLHSVTYASPREYLAYFTTATRIVIDEPAAIEHYVELKATRDLLVHNAGIVNDIYLEKAGKGKRARLGKVIPITQAYYDQSFASLKRIAIGINDGGWKTYGS